ncbi:MAG: tetratricopeptide repeat protein [Planctomycetota bacterium]|nr:tetratricopeptide repeat protein [Planctomycetota bacterium]
MPSPKARKRRTFLIVGGAVGLLAGAVLAVAITLGLMSGTRPSPSPTTDNPSPKTIAKAPFDRAMEEPGTAAAPAPFSPEQLFENASPAVVYIIVRDKDFKSIGLGSGFFVDAKGLIVTNYHVIKGAEFATARLSSGATLFVDGWVATDPEGDLALLKVSDGGYPCLRISHGGLPKVGAAVYAIGNPQGLANTFSSGMVSGHREIKAGFAAIQITAPISPGSSGGPLLNARGEVIGVTTAYLSGGQNLNFAVPVSSVSALMRKQGKLQTLASAGGRRLDSAETEEMAKAWAAMDKKDWGTATKILTSLREKQKDNPVVWFALGDLHSRLGNHATAIEHYRVAIALKPDYAAAYFGMGLAYHMLKCYPEAIETFKKVIAIDPNDVYSYTNMGGAYEKMNRYAEAIAAYKKAMVIDPNNSWPYVALARAYANMKRYAEAIAAYEQSLRIEPTGWFADSVREELARVLRLAGQ